MPVGTTLVNLRQMLMAETGDEMSETIAAANVTRYNRLLSNMQSWLVGKDAWLMPGKVRKEVALTAGTRLYSMPTGIDLQSLAYPAHVKFDRLRFYLDFGISQQDYNIFDPTDTDHRLDPVLRWDVVDDAGTKKLEVWPIPASDQTVIFEGKPVLGALASDSDTCVVDDLLLVLFTAAKILGKNGQACLSQAQDRLNWLKGNRPSEFEVFSLSGRGTCRCREDRPMVGVTDYSVSYIRFQNGVTQIKADDGLWYDFRLVIDQGQTTLEIGQTGTQ